MTLLALLLAATVAGGADSDSKASPSQDVVITLLNDGTGVEVKVNGKRMNCAEFNAFLAKGAKNPEQHPTLDCTTGRMKFGPNQ